MRAINHLKTVVLLGALMALCMGVGHLVMPGPNGIRMGLLFGGAGSLVAYFFSDKIAVLAMGGRVVTRQDIPWLYDMIERLTRRGGLPMPRIYVCPQEAPNAFATGRNPRHSAVAITQGMLRTFPPREIEGVMAHELGHIKHRDVLISTIAAVLAGVISYAGYMLMWSRGGNRDSQSPLGAIGAVAMIILAPIAALLIQMAISRQREYAADSFAGELCGDPLKLTAALERLTSANERIPTDTNPAFHSLYIVRPLAAGGLASLFSTHPAVEKRIAVLLDQARRTVHAARSS